MQRIVIILAFLIVISFGAAIAYQPIDKTTQPMTFTGGPGFPPVDITTAPMLFTGQ